MDSKQRQASGNLVKPKGKYLLTSDDAHASDIEKFRKD
jgi:hypothetical protein